MRLTSILLLAAILTCLSISNWHGIVAVSNCPDLTASASGPQGTLVTPSPDLMVPINIPTPKSKPEQHVLGPAKSNISGPIVNAPVPITSEPNMDTTNSNLTLLLNSINNSNQTINRTMNQTINQMFNQTGNMSSNQTQTTQTQQGTKQMDVTGKWSIKLNNGTDRSLDLNLWSSGGTGIMGYGTLNEEGAKNSATVSGSVGPQELILIAKSAAPDYTNQKDKAHIPHFNFQNRVISLLAIFKYNYNFYYLC